MTVHRNRAHHHPRVYRRSALPTSNVVGFWFARCPCCGLLTVTYMFEGGHLRSPAHISQHAAFITALRHAEEHLS